MSKNRNRAQRLLSLAKPLKNTHHQKKNILQLPNEIMHRILESLPLLNFHRVRATCRQFKQMSDNQLIYNYNKAVSQNGANNSNELVPKSAMLMVIQQATWAFVAGGNNKSVFSACLLMICYQSLQSRVYVSIVTTLNIFLEKFFDEMFSKPIDNQSRLLYLNTLLGFLNRSDLATRTHSILHGKQNGIILTYTMTDLWFGMLWADKQRQLQYPDDRKAVILLLSHLLLCVLENTFNRDVIGYGPKLFIYGREKFDPERKLKYKMIWSIRVFADRHVVDYLKSSPDSMAWQPLPASSNLEVAIDLKCSKAQKWGCNDHHHFEI